jgi:hypothetical protein
MPKTTKPQIEILRWPENRGDSIVVRIVSNPYVIHYRIIEGKTVFSETGGMLCEGCRMAYLCWVVDREDDEIKAYHLHPRIAEKISRLCIKDRSVLENDIKLTRVVTSFALELLGESSVTPKQSSRVKRFIQDTAIKDYEQRIRARNSFEKIFAGHWDTKV